MGVRDALHRAQPSAAHGREAVHGHLEVVFEDVVEDLDVPGEMLNRAGGLVVNSINASIAGALGWAMGALLPEDPARPRGPDTRGV